MTNVNESGRSMVEMLGVLAIIGVLSIGGIAGYTMAMTRYRANEIVDAASKMAVIAMTQQSGHGVDQADIGLDTGGIAGTTCTLEVTTKTQAESGIVMLKTCTGDVLNAIVSIAGTTKFKNDTSNPYFRFDGKNATTATYTEPTI